jgi:hypothetical protein
MENEPLSGEYELIPVGSMAMDGLAFTMNFIAS